MRTVLKAGTALVIAGGFIVAFSQSAPAAPTPQAPAALPMGVTMTPPQTGRGGRGSAARNTSGVLGDAASMTLYFSDADTDAGKPTCVDACAKEWPALTAPPRAVLSPEWTVIARADGVKQWAYKGKPLYLSTKDEKPGDTKGDGADGKWHTATYQIPGSDVPTPAGITVKQNDHAGGDVFVDHRGMTLYMSPNNKCDETCRKSWSPLPAGDLAKPVSDWAISEHEDGTRQWNYKGQLVFTFTGDGRASDVNGIHFDEKWKPVALREYFQPPEVKMRKSGGLVVFTTKDGLTLYARDKYQYAPGSFHADDGGTQNVGFGREVGTDACVGACDPAWVPFKASKDAQPSGFWSIVTRADGTRQWAYQGYAIYANAQDKKPGDMMGRDVFDFSDGSHARYWRAATP
jgi:predicted lipoprotein with Yx(FWY)xxD motif